MYLPLWIIAIVIIVVWQGISTNNKIDKADADPTNTVKSDKWKRKNGLL